MRSPDLKSGETFATFSIFGKVEVSKLLFIRNISGGASSWAASFTNFAGTLSIPADLKVFTCYTRPGVINDVTLHQTGTNSCEELTEEICNIKF